MSFINNFNIKWKLDKLWISIIQLRKYTTKTNTNHNDQIYVCTCLHIYDTTTSSLSTHNVFRPSNNNSKHRSTSHNERASEQLFEAIRKLAISWNFDSHTYLHKQTRAYTPIFPVIHTYRYKKEKIRSVDGLTITTTT